MKKIVLISVGQPSTNPRIVKEANILTLAGYDVYVIYSFWTQWAQVADKQIFSKVRWRPILAGGSPFENQFRYFFSRLRLKLFRFLAAKVTFKFGIAEIASGRTYPELLKKAMSIKADLYIAHIQAALPAAVKAASKMHAKCMFDAEDFHRQEATDDANSYEFKISKYIDDKYLPTVDYMTASSPLIAEKYALLYSRQVTPILNVFPKTTASVIDNNTTGPIRLFWFSQTIGPKRGLEVIIEAMNLTAANIELHLLGQISEDYKKNLLNLFQDIENNDKRIFFYKPIESEQIFQFAGRFDIGLASEPGFCLNNKMALSNKLFTYIQSGLAVAASDTIAQHTFMRQYSKTGKVYKNANELSTILTEYDANRELLFQTKKESFNIGQTQLNWENESRIFMKVIKDTLTIN